MFERRLLGLIILNKDEKKIELSEKTQKILCTIDYHREKVLSIINKPIIKIPARLVWIVALVTVVSIADYGIYSAIDTLQSGIHTLEDWERINKSIFIMEQVTWILPIYVYYSILSTIYNIFGDIFTHDSD